ncbi:MAG: phosphotransferase system HPr (HPr) family protein [Enterobacterales bacterium]|jgi:phosphotransferase system HPr (HPr) family protein
MSDTDSYVIKSCCKIVNKYGLHTRSASAIVQLANQFPCEITFSTEKGESDANDMLRLMLLEASKGTEICVSAEGEQADKAVKVMISFVEAGFDENDD